MDWLTGVSLTVGVVSIILAVVAIVISILSHWRTKDVLAQISEKAAVIEGTVSETQGKLVDTVTAIAKPREETQEEKLLGAFVSSLASNPKALEQIINMEQRRRGSKER